MLENSSTISGYDNKNASGLCALSVIEAKIEKEEKISNRKAQLKKHRLERNSFVVGWRTWSEKVWRQEVIEVGR